MIGIISLLTLFLCTSHAQQWPSYYSLTLDANDNLRQSLFLITSSKHIAFEDDADRLTSDCQPEAIKCFGHREYSYRDIRKELFKSIDLRQDEKGQYHIFDVYCQEIVTKGVGPNTVPAHTELNAEHLWPQLRFNPIFSKNLQKADLHHLFPVKTYANSRRGNHHFGEVNNPISKCPASGIGQIDGQTLFEPPTRHKGDIARALFYFSIRYLMPIDDQEEKFLRKWHREDPVSIEENERHERIFSIQENRNPFIDLPQLVDQIENF